MEFLELVDQVLLSLGRVVIGQRPPGDEQCVGVGQLPDVATAPMARRQTGAVAAVVGKPLLQSVVARGFADVYDRCPVHPGITELVRSHGWVTALERPAGLVGRNGGGEVFGRITT